ncbi:DUF397 domain-containing protein [Kitasatospora sp. NPDC096077]|uniref:DUF397 domain-containing protein n=1 Tax=Kitasatospora sp. NPDC096077 TaxID=3155544 RepID=UPI003325B31C
MSANLEWRKSTYSHGDGDCVEVADGITGTVPVRDSKDPHGPELTFTPAGWQAFIVGIRSGDFPNTP